MTTTLSPLVTIGIPTYNRADGNLKLALQSAMDQTYPNIEIIVSDNCSDDDTESVVRRYSDPRVRYFRQDQNIGANANYNFCLEQARGDYFLLLHDDDLIDPDFVATCMNAADSDIDIGIIRTGTRLINANGDVLLEIPNRSDGSTVADLFLDWIEGKTAFYFCSTLFNTAKLKKNRGLRTKKNLYEDVAAGIKLTAAHGKLDIYDIKASFRRHSGNRAGNRGSVPLIIDWCEESLYLLDIIQSLVGNDRRETIKQRGMNYFCKRNYRRAASVKSFIKRLIIYIIISKKFNNAYSLISFIYYRHIKPKIRSMASI